MRHFVRIVFALLLSVTPAFAQEPAELAVKARKILETNCHTCHGKDGRAKAGLNILNRANLVDRKKLVPGEPNKSRLFKKMLDKTMPPDEDEDTGKKVTQRPSPADMDLVKQWIERGAVDFNPVVVQRKFIGNLDILAAIAKDLDSAKARDRKFLRYFTITHLYNGGLSDEELASYRAGLSKLVNSLSWGREVHVPKEIDDARTIFRIDLRDLEWDEKVWDTILAANPYGVAYKTDIAKKCYDMTRTTQPFVRADWFVFAASRPPLYHEVLELPSTDRELEKMLRVDVAKNIRNERVRAGFNGSGVSGNNRIIERHLSVYGAYWKSYDFGDNNGLKNLFDNPLGPGPAKNQFKHDGGEIIFNLPNGLQAYLLTKADGTRIDKGPLNIVSDPKQRDRAVVNGVSCMSCHFAGMIEKDDQVRTHVERNRTSFGEEEADLILSLYAKRDTFQEKVKEDAERFQEAVKKTGSRISNPEPVFVLSRQFENEIDLKLAAAEAGVTVEAFKEGLKHSRALARIFGTLLTDGGTIKRDVLVASFSDLAKELQPDGEFIHGGQVVANEVDLGNKQKLILVPIKAKGKSFLMGSPDGDKDKYEDEQPQHEVAFTHDWDLAKFKVTVGQFKAFVAENPDFKTEAEKAGDKTTWRAPGFDQDDDHPVVQVSWNDAQAFCKWLSKKTGQKFRLPFEAEWEYSCRAGTITRYHFGDDEDKLTDFAWFDKNAGKSTQPVGKKKANPWELHDMGGNAWEWCEDGKREYRKEKVTDPEGPIAGANRVIRGGSWSSTARCCRSADRYGSAPSYRNDSIGFRVLRSR